MPYIWSKLHCTCGDHPDGAIWTKSSHFGLSDDLFRGQKARFRTNRGLKRTLVAHIMAFFWLPRGTLKVWNGPVMPSLLTWVSWTIMWCLEPNLEPYKTSRGAKSALCHRLWGSKRPPFDPQNPPQTPSKSPKPNHWPSLQPIWFLLLSYNSLPLPKPLQLPLKPQKYLASSFPPPSCCVLRHTQAINDQKKKCKLCIRVTEEYWSE